MKVADIMTKKVDSVTPASTLSEAAHLIFGKRHRGLPVIDGKSKKLVGFITDQDILSLLFPNVQEFIEDYVHERNFEDMEKKVKGILNKKVKDVMSPKVVSVHVEDPLLRAESIMKIKDIARLPVIDDNGRLIGILSKGDIFRAIVGRDFAKKK